MYIWLRELYGFNTHDEVHVVNVVNEDKTCGIQVHKWL